MERREFASSIMSSVHNKAGESIEWIEFVYLWAGMRVGFVGYQSWGTKLERSWRKIIRSEDSCQFQSLVWLSIVVVVVVGCLRNESPSFERLHWVCSRLRLVKIEGNSEVRTMKKRTSWDGWFAHFSQVQVLEKIVGCVQRPNINIERHTSDHRGSDWLQLRLFA